MPLEHTTYEDGGWCEREFMDGKLHGRWTVYFPSGKKHWERHYQAGRQEGYEREWDEHGNLREEKTYHLGVLHGLWREWNAEGVEEIVGDFLFGTEKHHFEKWPPRPHSNYERVLPYWMWEPAQFREQLPAVERALVLPSWRLIRDKSRQFRDEFGASYFNYVNLAGVDEEWPCANGAPLIPLVQVDWRGLAPLPHFIKGTAFLTMFARPNAKRRSDLVVRTYRAGEPLRQVKPPPESITKNPRFISIGPVESSFPDRNDLPPGLLALLEDEYPESLMLKEWEHRFSSRIGGWPAWLQESGVYSYGEFALQLDRLDIPALRGGDSAVHYFFRDESEWTWASESLSPLYDSSGPR